VALIQGVQFPNSRTLEQYYASDEAGNVLFGSFARSAISTAGQLIAACYNPSNSGVIMSVFRIVLTHSVDGEWTRYRGGTFAGGTTAPQPANNRGGGSNTTSGKLWAIGTGVTATNGNREKGVAVYGKLPETTYENGSILIKPGQLMYWMFAADTSTISGSLASANAYAGVEIVWAQI
jgi:hypothetical protein